MGVMAVRAGELFGFAKSSIPVAVDAAMRTSFPIAIVRAVATATKLRAVGKF